MSSVLVVLFALVATAIASPTWSWSSLLTPATSKLVVNGFQARRLQFPYQAALRVISQRGSGFCGGSIISSLHILTAAHCAAAPVREIHVRVGSIKMRSGGASAIVSKENLIIHPQFDRNTLVNDIAVLRLPQKLQFSAGIQPIRLPADSHAHEPFENARGRVSGWGLTNAYGGDFEEDLRFVDVRVIPNRECSLFFTKTQRITDEIMCAVGPHANMPGGQNQGHCNGDSGGPLVIQENNGHLVQIGVVSFASKGACLRRPSGFVRTGYHLDFIRAAVGGNIEN